MVYNAMADILIGNEKFKEARKELETIVSATQDQWMKEEAQRKINDINARLALPEEVEETTAAPEVKVEPSIEPEKVKTEEKKKR